MPKMTAVVAAATGALAAFFRLPAFLAVFFFAFTIACFPNFFLVGLIVAAVFPSAKPRLPTQSKGSSV